MDDEGHEHAVLAKAAYDYYLESPEIAEKELKEYGFKDYVIDHEHSDDHAVTIVKPDGSAVISYRGTSYKPFHPTMDYDLLADSLILSGTHNIIGGGTRFQRANEHYNKVKKIYPDVTLVGHSLGGKLASHVGRLNNEKVYMYNKGSGPMEMLEYFGNKKFHNHKHYTTGHDPISFASSFSNREHVIDLDPEESHDFIGHSLNYFLPQKKKIKELLHKEVKEEKGKGLVLDKTPFCKLYPEYELCRRR